MTHQKHTNPKPDDRSDNVEKLQRMVENTIQNIEAAEETMEFTHGPEREQIAAKNKRREEAINGFREELKDEAKHNK